jgi:putative membrane protein insertion efficiency factor
MKKLILILLKLYKQYISPGNFGIKICRFEPSCSRYAYEAVEKHGVIRGGIMSIWRVIRCNPFNKGGYDPVQ